MQYWATSACCLGVLILLCVITWKVPRNMHPNSLHNTWHAKVSLSCIALYIVLCCVSLGTISLTGGTLCDYFVIFFRIFVFSCLRLNTVPKLLWFLCLDCCFLFFDRLQYGAKVIVDDLSWVGSCEINTTSAQYFSVLCFYWFVSCYYFLYYAFFHDCNEFYETEKKILEEKKRKRADPHLIQSSI